ncbi:MAG: transcriptional regulator [Candidatus Binatia bacterium]
MTKEQAAQVVSFGPYRLDLANGQLRRGVQEVRLTGKALAVLRYFVEQPGQLVSKDDLFQSVWPETVVTDSTLTSCIQELRQALRDNAKQPRYIETLHRRGYRFLGNVGRSQQSVASSPEGARGWKLGTSSSSPLAPSSKSLAPNFVGREVDTHGLTPVALPQNPKVSCTCPLSTFS